MRGKTVTAILRIARTVSGSSALQAVLDTVVQEARDLVLKASGASLVVFEGNGQAYMRTQVGLPAALNEIPMSRERGLLREILETGQAARMADYQAFVAGGDSYMSRRAAATPVRSVCGVPLASGGRVLGALFVGREEVRPFTDEEVERLLDLANFTTLAVENARLRLVELDRAEKLAELDQTRTRFVSVISHELRNPVAGLRGALQTLRARWAEFDEATKLRMLDRAEGSAQRLTRLVDDLTVVTQADGGILQVDGQPVDVAEPAGVARSEVQSKYFHANVDLAPPPEPVLAMGDSNRIAQILVNLIDNAVKYSPPDTPVLVSWRREGSETLTTVSDQGPGIPAEEMSLLFRPYVRASAAEKSGTLGTGLGLYVCRQLAEAMKGRLSVESAPGQGAVFTLTLPAGTRRE